MAENIEEKVTKIVAEQFEVSADKITLKSQFMDDLKADSLSVVELVLAIEEAFGLEIPDEDAEKIKTVGDVVNYVKSRA
jgi:acyl carrier protein